MTGLAQISTGDVVTRLTSGLASVVTADTVAGDTTVVKRCSGEAVGVVTILAVVRTLRVISCFTQRDGAVMAADARTLNFGVINATYHCPTAWRMAGLTGVGTGDVVTWLAGGLATVMAADAVTGDTAVVKGYAGERVGVVAVFAVIRTG